MDQFDFLTNFILIYDKIRGSESFGFENSQEKKSVLVKGVTAWAS